MDAEIFILWFHHVFVLSVKEHFKKKGMPENSRIVHLLDNYHVHHPAKELINGIMEPFVDFQLWFQIKVFAFCVLFCSIHPSLIPVPPLLLMFWSGNLV
jgi:hypothetical protein